MHNLEPGRLVAPQRGGVPHVARLALARDVLEHDVGRLEDAQRERVRAVLPDRLEQARQERRADHLELERLGVRDLHRRLAVVGHPEPREVFLVGTLFGHVGGECGREGKGKVVRREWGGAGKCARGCGVRTRMRGRTSTQPAYAHSCRMISLSLLTASGCATVLVAGKTSGRLLNP